jgi:hypothetical protein
MGVNTAQRGEKRYEESEERRRSKERGKNYFPFNFDVRNLHVSPESKDCDGAHVERRGRGGAARRQCAFTQRAVDVTDNRITSGTAASNLRGTVGALLAIEMQMLRLCFHFRNSWCRQNTTPAHLKLKAYQKWLQERYPFENTLRNVRHRDHCPQQLPKHSKTQFIPNHVRHRYKTPTG